eukprot:7740025-Lingulodinium_polyedra.AAC.1
MPTQVWNVFSYLHCAGPALSVQPTIKSAVALPRIIIINTRGRFLRYCQFDSMSSIQTLALACTYIWQSNRGFTVHQLDAEDDEAPLSGSRLLFPELVVLLVLVVLLDLLALELDVAAGCADE